MNSLRTLHDAFAELEERADAATSLDHAVPVRPARRRLAPPLAAAAAVLAVVAGVAAWQASRDSHPARQPAASGPTTAPTPVSTTGAAHVNGFQPPSTVAALSGKARSILAGTATITVDPTQSAACDAGAPTRTEPPGKIISSGPDGALSTSTATMVSSADPPVAACSGAALVGTLTSGGLTGGFDLDVYRAEPEDPFCDGDAADCVKRTLPDGSRLASTTWKDSQVAGGVTYQVSVVRPDGGEIIFHLSTERSPKGASEVIAPRVPLTLAQMEGFVTSDQW